MATDVERLLVRMEVAASKFERDMSRARQTVDRETRDIERRMRDTNKSMEDAFSGIGAAASRFPSLMAPIGAAIAGAFSVDQVRRFADGFTRTINALKVAGLEGDELRQTYEDLFAIANRQGAPIEDLAKLFGQLTQAQNDLGVSSQTIKNIVEATGQALRVSGVPATQASGAILGLSQALSGGTVRAEEFNQMLEGGLRPALQAVANGLREAEGSVGKLRQIVTEGELSSKDFARALEAGQAGLAALSARAEETSSQALNRLNNALLDAVGKLNEATGASRGFASGIGAVADAVGAAAARIPALVAGLNEIIRVGGNALNILNGIGRSASGANFAPRTQTGIAELREELAQIESELAAGRSRSRDVAQFNAQNANRINQAQDLRNRIGLAQRLLETVNEIDREGNRGRGFGNIAAPTSVTNPVSKNDNPPDGKGGAGGGGRSAAERISNYDREVEALNRRTAALQLDITTFGQSAAAISKAKVEQELLNALQKDGISASEEQRQKVSELAQTFVDAEQRLKQLRDGQQAFNELQRFVGSTLSSFFSDIVSGGKNAEQAMMNLVKRLADVALQAALLGDGPLAGVLGLKGSGGLIGALFGAFAPGRSLGGPVRAGQPYTVGENGRELFVPTQPGRIINARQASRGGGGTVRVMIESDGRLPAMIRAEAQGVAVQVSQAAVAQNNRTLPAMLRENDLR
jgi:tape measure domain-containing protein